MRILTPGVSHAFKLFCGMTQATPWQFGLNETSLNTAYQARTGLTAQTQHLTVCVCYFVFNSSILR